MEVEFDEVLDAVGPGLLGMAGPDGFDFEEESIVESL